MRHSFLTWLSFAAALILGASPALADFTKSDMAPPPQEVVDLVTRDKECHLYEGTNPLDMWEGTTLSSDVRVHLLPCFMGAYNLASIVVIEYRGEAEPASTYTQQFFASYGADYGWVGSSTLTNAFISPETGHLVHFHKGRGLGDCGTTGEWDWNGYIFAMVEYRVQEECNGTAPDQWPVLYTRITADPETPDVAADCSVAPYCEDRDYFGDYLVACRQVRSDGSRYCSANAYIHNADAPAGFDYQMRVFRERRSAPAQISWIAVDEFMDRTKPVSIGVNGHEAITFQPAQIETPEAINEYVVNDRIQTVTLLEQMRAGEEVTFTYAGESGKSERITFSLKGLTASLLWMEEFAGK